ncbi:MAG: hypothetical protein ACRD4H_07380 [Candidatus Acidiferrales bacterium]
MASKKPKRPCRTKAIEPDESPERVHRVAMQIAAIIEGQKWAMRYIELKSRGELKASNAARASARKFVKVVREIERGTDTRLIDEAASKLPKCPDSRRAY